MTQNTTATTATQNTPATPEPIVITDGPRFRTAVVASLADALRAVAQIGGNAAAVRFAPDADLVKVSIPTPKPGKREAATLTVNVVGANGGLKPLGFWKSGTGATARTDGHAQAGLTPATLVITYGTAAPFGLAVLPVRAARKPRKTAARVASATAAAAAARFAA